MKYIKIIPAAIMLISGVLSFGGCQKGDLIDNPNVAGGNSLIPVSLILNHLTANLVRPTEEAWGDAYKYSQYFNSNYQYYRGTNFYNWTNTADTYDILKYATALQAQSKSQFSNPVNKYAALAKFFKAYGAIWLSNRVGDIPFSQAVNPMILKPKYDTQHDVFKQGLALLDSANTMMAAVGNGTAVLDANGDIFGLTNLQWQRVINTYRLRVLISLSKRAADNADLNIPGQFAAIVSNPTLYPIMTGNSDNMTYKYNAAFNPYPIKARGNQPYNNFANMGKTFMDILTGSQDPRTFLFATPAPVQIAAAPLGNGKAVSDFTAYVGSDNNLSQTTVLFNNAADSPTKPGQYSFANYNRYYTTADGSTCEPLTVIGYAEMCFNIAEAINRGWVSGTSATWYLNGINASLKGYSLAEGQSLTVGDVNGKALGTVQISIARFLANPAVVYNGDNAAGLAQILTQKYVSFFINSGYEAFYNNRRTGLAAFSQGGAAIGTVSGMIPRRWEYPAGEISGNSANYQTALTAQYSGTDDISKDMWLTK